jgi:UDP-N-acetylglucosamine acyltransferase
MMRKVHSTAVVSKKAKLGKDVVIGPFVVIDDNVTIGDGTIVGPHCQITGNTTIGKANEIFNGAVIGSRPQDLKFKGEKTFLEIGDRNFIREYVTMNPGTHEGGGRTVVGSGNLFMAYSHVAHDCHVGSHCIMANCGSLAGHVTVEDHVVISGLAAVHQFVRVGKFAIIGGCSKVVQDIPPFSTCDGHPARMYGLNRVGLRRNNFSVSVIKELDRAFNSIFNSGLPLKKALAQFGAEKDLGAEALYLINFIKNSSRGMTRSVRSARSGDEE